MEVYFHTSVWGKEGSKDSGLFCLMWYLLDASLFFLESVLCSVFFPLNFLVLFFFLVFWKNYCILSLYHGLMSYPLLYAVFKFKSDCIK